MSESRRQRRERARRMLEEPVLVGSGSLPDGGTFDIVTPARSARTADEQRAEFERMAAQAVREGQVLLFPHETAEALLDVHGGDRRSAERWMAVQARRAGQGVAALFPTADPAEGLYIPELRARLPYTVSFAPAPALPEAVTRGQVEEACQTLVALLVGSLGEEPSGREED